MPTVPTAPAVPAFPTYAEWLSGHDDDVLVDLLWRLRAFHGFHGSTGGSRDILGAVTDIAALRRLTAVDLAVLHALVTSGAAAAPVGTDDVTARLTELCDIAGTQAPQRPDAATVAGTIGTLATWGLVYGPGLSLTGGGGPGNDPGSMMVPGHMPPLFAGTTDLPWLLVDGYRCPVPTEELPGVLEDLPSRQHRLLETLGVSGGIGHSATLNDPERPLAKMVAAGLLDQLDDQTARLSPRVAAAIAGLVVPSPGGDFTRPANPADVHPDDRTDASAVSRAVETVRLVTDVLTEVGRTPLRPLAAGGVGVREVSRLAKVLADKDSPEAVTDALVMCRHADLVARGLPLPTPQGNTGTGDHWAVTDRGVRFLSAPLARRWAMLLDGWRDSAHAAWLADSPDAHLLQESLDLPEVAALRGVTADVLVNNTGDRSPADLLWRLRPSVAAVTTTESLDGVLSESVSLGLSADGAPSSVAVTLTADGSESDLAEALDGILPDPVRMLIIQGDMTILAPGLLDTDTERQLQVFADVESTGMASVWRVTRESMQRAAEGGGDAGEIESFLRSMAPEIPQSLHYLIQDTFRNHEREEPVVGSTAASVLTVPDAATMDTIMATPAAAETGLRRIAPTVAISSTQLSQVVEALEDDGVQISVEGDSAHVSGPGAQGLLSVVPDPNRPAPSRDEVSDQLAGAVESFRRARQADLDGTGGGAGHGNGADGTSGETVREPREIMAALRRAYDHGTQVEVSYVDAAGSAVRDWISVVTMSPVAIVAVTEAGGRSLQIQPHRVAWVTTPGA
ncbi:MAG: helicase-associated domain-containing protein [Corynebacterium sp.]